MQNKGNKLSIEMASFENIDKILCNSCHYELKAKLDDYLIGRTEYYYKATKSK